MVFAATPLRAQTLGEALNATNLVWTTGGDAPWFVETTNTYDGMAVQGGNIQAKQTSWLQTTVVGPATVSFWFESDSFSGGWNFAINGPDSGPWPISGIGPSPVWQNETNDVGDGTNVLRWTVFSGSEEPPVGCFLLGQFTVSPPRSLAIEQQPLDTTVYVGNDVFLNVEAQGTPPFQYQWYDNGTNLPGATNYFLYFTPTTTNASGNYSVIVTNSQGFAVSSNATVTVLPPSPPIFDWQPASAVVYVGQTFSFWTSVEGTQPISYQWFKDGTNLPNATESELTLASVSPADAGDYTLYVTNLYGGVESTNAVLTVLPSVAPAITNQPRSLDVAAGVDTWLAVGATGAPSPSYTWNEVGQLPAAPAPPGLLPFGLSPSTRVFNNVTATNAGIYFATASNFAGAAVSQEALLTVLPPITNVVTWSQDAVDIFVTNGLAFLARGTNGLAVLDVTNPAAPQLLGTLATTDNIVKLAEAGGLVYAAADDAGLQIISVANPCQPVLVGTYTANAAEDVTVRSNLTYVADGAGGLLILDTGNPAAPVLAGSFVSNFYAEHVRLMGNLAVLTSDDREGGGLIVVDVSDPARPVELGGELVEIGNLEVSGQTVFGIETLSYITMNWPYVYLDVISLTNAAQPALVGSFDGAPPSANLFSAGVVVSDVRVANNLVFLAGSYTNQASVYVVDVADATQPIPVGYYTGPGQPTALAVDNGWVYMAGAGSPLEILKTPFDTSPPAPPKLSVSPAGGVNLSLQGRHGRYYTVEYSDGLTGAQWQPLQTLMLTNDTVVLPISNGGGSRFFRLEP